MKKYRVSFRVKSTQTLSYDIESDGNEDKAFLRKVAIDRFYADVKPTLQKAKDDSLDYFEIEEIENKEAPWISFLTHNDTDIETMGTSLQGIVRTTYRDLVEIFGKDTCVDTYKTDAEWEVIFGDNQVATIYNYKDGRNYLGEDGLDKKDIIDWHVGGKSKDFYYRIEEILTDKGAWNENETEAE